MSVPIVSILIPSLASRARYLNRLLTELSWQIESIPNGNDFVEICKYIDNGEATTGAKRNWLTQNAKGSHVAGFDDDDMPTDVYIQTAIRIAQSGADCGELRGLYFSNGVYDRPFHHSIAYDHWFQNAACYFRNPNHISLIKRELILDIPFKDITVGEDGNFSIDLQKSGRLKKQFDVKETTYLYYARSKQSGT